MSTDWSLPPLVVLLPLVALLVVGTATAGTVSAMAIPAETDTTTAIDSVDHVPASMQDSRVFTLQSNGTESDTDTGNEPDTDAEPGDESDNSTDTETGTGTDSSSDAENESNTTTEPTAEPEAVLDAPSAVDTGTSLTLDASASDPGDDDEIETYVWEITGSNEYETSTSEPTLEYTFDESGATEVGLEAVTDADRRAQTATTIDVADRTLTVEGQIRHAKTDASSFYDSVRLVDEGDVVAETRADADGSFTLSPDEPGTYGLVYVDERLDSDSKPGTDGTVDLYAIDTVTIDNGNPTVDVGSQTLPLGFPLNLAVVGDDSERPVEGATVTVTGSTGETEISREFRTDENGRLFPDEDHALEVTHAADVEVEPPSSGDLIGSTRSINVDPGEDTMETITLAEAINASLEIDPNPPALGENVTVTVNETRGIAETVSWTVDGRDWNGTNETTDRIGEIRPGDRTSENETITRSLEMRVTELGEFNVSARVIGDSRRTDIATAQINVTEPERKIGLEVPDETATHTPVAVTAVHDVERGNVSVEQYEWRLLDDDGNAITLERTTDPTTEFTVQEVGQYALELELQDEFGLTESATTTVEADSVPSWVTGGESRFEIETIEVPHAVEPGGVVPLEVSTTNVGDAPGRAAVTVETDGDTLADERLELGVDETESISLSPAAPDRTGNHTLTVATDHERTTVSYAVTENPESSAATRLESDSNAAGGDEPQELELLPTPSTAADIEPPSPLRDRLRTVLLGGAAVAILGGFGLVGYVIYTRPERDR